MRRTIYTGRCSTEVGVCAELSDAGNWIFVCMRGRSLASSSFSSSESEVFRLTQEKRSSDAKNADATLLPTQQATPSSFSYDKILGFSIFDEFLRSVYIDFDPVFFLS
ncbi:unnamed protein product [Lactuca saligna]|uniref:Uncharacterized protein n=1 Tax=Lactuca saligna TaxID=75948 RepID=A0AA36EGI2_LACSI|nr:unnamed protein product [Lactuca saligna]